ncbi:4533_t:CDS:1, partial [Gigaspora rosea]
DYVTDKNQNPKNSQLLSMERNIDEGETNEKAMVYVPFLSDGYKTSTTN